MPILGGKKFAPKSVIRVESRPKLMATSAKASPRASPKPSGSKSLLSRTKSASPYPSSSDEKRTNDRKRKAGSAGPGPSQPKFDDDSDGDEDEDFLKGLEAPKRLRLASCEFSDENRTLTRQSAFKEGLKPLSRLIHAAHITNEKSCPKAKRVLKATEKDDIRVKLQYPSMYGAESYELLYEDGKIDAVKDIRQVVEWVANVYLTGEQAQEFTDPDTGIIRRLKKAIGRDDFAGFTTALKDGNERIRALSANGTIRKNLDKMHGLPNELAKFILAQVYDRTVSPNVEKLKQYKNGTDNVYGELLFPFISEIFAKTRLTSDQVFIDLGSGVGNVVFQAALQIGCESWGCEMMDNPCDFAEAQEKEFGARCKMWGLLPGRVNLERGDFTKNSRIHEVLKRADVILVNNQAFTPELNSKLVDKFLDLKKGCKVVSLKSFVNDQGSRNMNDVANNILDVERHTYSEGGYVSWTDSGGSYCISTKKNQ